MKLKFGLFNLLIYSMVDCSLAFVHCFDNFDPATQTCYGNAATTNEEFVSKCCHSIKSQGYAAIQTNEGSIVNKEIRCTPCASYLPREKVYCFSLGWYIEGRTCHILHADWALDIIECCKSRNATGYNVKLDIYNASNPKDIIYNCIPCTEPNFAEQLTPWTPCSTTCGGGWRTQQLTCSRQSSSKCLGAKTLKEQCNMQPCSKLSKTAKILIGVVVAVVVIAVIGVIIFFYRRKKNESRTLAARGESKVGFHVTGKEDQHVNFSPYSRDPTAPRELPKTPEFNPKPSDLPPAYSATENDDTSMYEYVGLDRTYDNEERGNYLSMK